MPYDLFISYARRDNERGQVAALKLQIESSFRAFGGRDLQVCFETHEIAGMDDWRQKIQRSLRDSQIFLAVLSPHYLASPYCRWEWEATSATKPCANASAKASRPSFSSPSPTPPIRSDQALARWIDEIQRRQTFDLRPWHNAGEQALQ